VNGDQRVCVINGGCDEYQRSDTGGGMIDVDRARQETPGCNEVLHFNNAGSALSPTPVAETVRRHLQRETQIGGYEAADQAQEALEHTYAAIAAMLGCASDEVALVENATRGWDMAFYGLRFEAGDRILTGRAEYASNVIAFLQVARRTGALVEIVPNDESGAIDVAALKRMIDDRVKLVALTHVPTNGGLVNPAASVGAVTREARIPFLLDACQSAGQMPLDVETLGCDMLSATGRKFLRAPRGTGFLYVRRDWIERIEPPFLDLHAATWTSADTYEVRTDARRFESWESFVAGRLGLGVAVDYAMGLGLEEIEGRVTRLAEALRARLSDVAGATVHDRGTSKCGIVTFTVDGEAPAATHRRLRASNINCSVSPARYARLDMDERGLTALVRASVHYYNTEEEIARFCFCVAER
jgi:cysteine desulfurase/selenocysteine lyase